jgi:anti-sigma regulatory factor (Ser/Thr protein kinase)
MTACASHHVMLDWSVDAPGRARAALDMFGPPDLTGIARDDVRLMLSEVVANSIRHAAALPPLPIELTIELVGRTLHVAVSDAGPPFDPSALPRPDPVTGGGWGLHLVGLLSSAWGVSAERAEVWFDLDLDSEPLLH